MQGEPSDFWGKLERDQDNRVVTWHPLLSHMADVSACCEALLQRTQLRQRLARLGGLPSLTDIHIARLSVLACLHDLGKFNQGFQNKALLKPSVIAGHVAEAVSLLELSPPEVCSRLSEALQTEQTLYTWGDAVAVQQLLYAAIGHHGRPVNALTPPPYDNRLWEETAERAPIQGIADAWQHIRLWFPLAFIQSEELLPSTPDFQHVFAGLVMLADWLGSDKAIFRYSLPGEGDRIVFAREQATGALHRIGLDCTGARSSLGEAKPCFSSISSYPNLRGGQQAVLDTPIPPEGEILVLEAETGSGKTEAALLRFMQLFHAGLVDGMYFALPTRTAATQIHRRIQKAISRAYPDPDNRPPVILAVPGYLAVDDRSGRLLPGFEVLWNDNDQERWRFRGWAAEHPKRFLAGAVVVGTIDQVLLSTLKTNHAHLRATSLLRQLLVVDEVHASDAYMNRLLEEVLAHHLQAGGYTLLMSATLGAAARSQLIYPKRNQPPPSLSEAEQQPYPARTWRPLSRLENVSPERIPLGLPRSVSVKLLPLQDEPASIAELALAAARRGARVLVLRNTVRDCLATQLALEERVDARERHLLLQCVGQCVPHHARYTRQDRQLLDDVIEEAFRGSARGGIIAVTTQTVQQSLDLDADLLLTDLCPMDVLLQRIGRLHRHSRTDRPVGFQHPQVLVLVPPNRALSLLLRSNGEVQGHHGYGTVYEDLCIIEATWQQLEAHPTLHLPQQSRALVENTTHPQALDAIARFLGASWLRHRQSLAGLYFANRVHASLNVIPWHVTIGEREATWSREDTGRISTRLGEHDRLVELPDAPLGPFGKRIRQLTVPGWMCRDFSDEISVNDLQQKFCGFSFFLGAIPFQYTRFGLERLEVGRDISG